MNARIIEAMGVLQRGEGGVDEALQLLQSAVYGFSMRLCGQREDAEDTMQEVLLQVLPYLKKIDDPRAMSVWLYKTARTRCLMKHRKQQTSRMSSLDELLPGGEELSALLADKAPTPEDAALSAQQSEGLQKAVRELDAAHRMILVLHDMEELTTSEVAEAMEVSEAAVRVRLHRARLALRRQLSGAPAPSRRRKVSVKCRRIFAALSDYMDQRVDEAACARIRQHMDGCPACLAFLEDLRRVVERCQQSSAACSAETLLSVRRLLLEEYRRLSAHAPAPKN